MTPQIDIYNDQVYKLIPKQLKIDKLASGFKFAESPLVHPQGFVLVSDVTENKIFKVSASGKVNLYWENSGLSGSNNYLLSDMIGSNGMVLDEQGNLFVCQHGNHAIVQRNDKGEIKILTNAYNKKPFNSPNDIVRRADGVLFFTDPPYGLRDQILQTDIFQSYAGIYSHQHGETRLLSIDLRYPNGLCFSQDERYLFVSSNHPDEPYIWRYELNAKAEIISQSVFIQQNADGIKTDRLNNLYLAVNKGLLIVSDSGKRLALIHLPELTTNMCWGNKGGFSAYATTSSSLYHLYG